MSVPTRTARKIDYDVETRDSLMLAACRVIGRRGYKAASIARIAEEAGISIGHCYKFFPSRDAILEHVILWVIERFECFAEKRLAATERYFDYEMAALRAYFAYQERFPFFITVLRDSEVETPSTWAEFAERRHRRYVDVLNTAFKRGEIRGFTADQLENVSRMLSSMRRSIVFHNPTNNADRDDALAAYSVFMRQALNLPA